MTQVIAEKEVSGKNGKGVFSVL